MLGLTIDQGLAIAIVALMLGFFIWNRWRYDVVALAALLAAVIAGIDVIETSLLLLVLGGSRVSREP